MSKILTQGERDAIRALFTQPHVVRLLATIDALEAELAAERQQKCDAVRYANQQYERVLAAERELERWRHGTTIEGDFVCPHQQRADAAERQAAAPKEALQELCDLQNGPPLRAERHKDRWYVAMVVARKLLNADTPSGWLSPGEAAKLRQRITELETELGQLDARAVASG